MGKTKFFIAVSLTYLILSCNVESIRKSRLQNTAEKQQSAQVDSFLYYQPIALTDPFLDSLKVQNDSQQAIKIRVIPPPAPAPATTKQVEGYRVQTFAGIDSLNALLMVNNLKAVFNDSIYFFKENELFKIQLGDYLYRNDADMQVLDLRKDGFTGSWVVQRLINVAIKADSLKDLKTKTDYPFKIQILVTSDVEKAKTIVKQLQNEFKMESSYVQSETLFKIFLGKFISREEAEKVLGNVRESGYKDAWLVHNK